MCFQKSHDDFKYPDVNETEKNALWADLKIKFKVQLMKMNRRNDSAWREETHMKTHTYVCLRPFSQTTVDCETVGRGGVEKQKYNASD